MSNPKLTVPALSACAVLLASCATSQPDLADADIANIAGIEDSFGPPFTVSTVGPAAIDPRLLGPQTLPEGLTFSEEDRLTTATREPLSAKDLEGLPNSGELNGVSWSASILFFPDGSATAVSFQVIDEQAGERTVTLRDLTGGVSVSRGNLDDEEL